MDSNLGTFSVIVLAVGVPIAAWISFPTRNGLERIGQRWAREWSAYVDPEFVPEFDRRTRRGVRARGFFVLCVVLGLAAWGQWPDPFGLIVISVLMAGNVTLGMVDLHLAAKPFELRSSRPRIARSRHLRVADYVSPWLWPLAGLELGVMVIAGALAPIESGSRGLAVGTVATAAVVVGACILLVPAMVKRPLPSIDERHLHMQDAWRASSVADLASTVGLFGLFIAPHFFDLGIGFLLPLCSLGLFAVSSDCEKRFRRRLWPDGVPGSSDLVAS